MVMAIVQILLVSITFYHLRLTSPREPPFQCLAAWRSLSALEVVLFLLIMDNMYNHRMYVKVARHVLSVFSIRNIRMHLRVPQKLYIQQDELLGYIQCMSIGKVLLHKYRLVHLYNIFLLLLY